MNEANYGEIFWASLFTVLSLSLGRLGDKIKLLEFCTLLHFFLIEFRIGLTYCVSKVGAYCFVKNEITYVKETQDDFLL